MHKQIMYLLPPLFVGSALLSASHGYAQSTSAASAPTDNPAPPPPKKGFFSSLGDSLKQAIDPKAVRGYFDASGQRYYCLVDTKTGANQAAAVQGSVTKSDDGTLTIKTPTVTTLSCDKAEQAGILVPTGNSSTAASTVAKTADASEHSPSEAPSNNGTGVDTPPSLVDVGGVKLGMSISDARAALKARKLFVLKEFRPDLGYPDPVTRAMVSIANTQFVSALMAASVANTPFDVKTDWEIIWILFTPEPGNEHVVQIHRTVNYAVAHAVREMDLDAGLSDKYQHPTNIGAGDALTWVLSAGRVLVPPMTVNCHTPSLAWDVMSGGVVPQVQTIYSKVEYIVPQPSNPVFVYTPGAWRSRMGCVSAVIMESHQSPNRTLPPEQRLVTQFDVNALSLSAAADASKAVSELIGAAADAAGKGAEKNAKKQPGPVL